MENAERLLSVSKKTGLKFDFNCYLLTNNVLATFTKKGVPTLLADARNTIGPEQNPIPNDDQWVSKEKNRHYAGFLHERT